MCGSAAIRCTLTGRWGNRRAQYNGPDSVVQKWLVPPGNHDVQGFVVVLFDPRFRAPGRMCQVLKILKYFPIFYPTFMLASGFASVDGEAWFQ